MSLLNFFYLYCAVGILVTLALLLTNKNKEKDISEIVHNKIHEMSNDGSFSFNSANFIGHLLAYSFSMLFWPVLIIKNLTGRQLNELRYLKRNGRKAKSAYNEF